MLVMLCTRCQQHEARVSSPETRAKFEAEFGTPWPFPDGICKECMPEWFKDPVNMERMEAVQRVMRARFRKQMEELGQKARAAALKVLDIADEIAGRF